jgi:hypothetical protein
MLKFTLSKKTWKYIFYAVIALVLLYVVFFGSTREHFASVNPLPTAADFAALTAIEKREEQALGSRRVSQGKYADIILKSAPESFKAAVRFYRANVVPLLPYSVVKANTNDDGSDNFDFLLLYFGNSFKDIFVLPFAYAVKQQTSPPTLSAFIDMGVKTYKDNVNLRPGDTWPDRQTQMIIDEMKKGEPTITPPEQSQTLPNPGYWGYRYIYGDPKVAPSGPAKPQAASKTGKASTGGAAGAAGAGGIAAGKCTPSFQQVPGGITETRCFN